MNIPSYGELYYDHYSKYVGEPVDLEIYKSSDDNPKLQILKYENVFQDCLVFNTLGLSHYEDRLQGLVEISMVVDEAFGNTGYILANALFFCVENALEIGRGTAIRGIERFDKSFVEKYHKHAIYFTEPFAFPVEYSHVCTGSEKKGGKVLLAFFISQAEYDYLIQYGTEKLEDLLEMNEVDPFCVGRKCIIKT
ncbi:suppressor of fused domain protein [Brevibacillus sp. 179-C9.3 HS]|uniref:suppressor of fused domain protein n=1 Tax=unclassified Brevibacillus TaxID=2684853 RepID=UPI00399F17C7